MKRNGRIDYYSTTVNPRFITPPSHRNNNEDDEDDDESGISRGATIGLFVAAAIIGGTIAAFLIRNRQSAADDRRAKNIALLKKLNPNQADSSLADDCRPEQLNRNSSRWISPYGFDKEEAEKVVVDGTHGSRNDAGNGVHEFYDELYGSKQTKDEELSSFSPSPQSDDVMSMGTSAWVCDDDHVCRLVSLIDEESSSHNNRPTTQTTTQTSAMSNFIPSSSSTLSAQYDRDENYDSSSSSNNMISPLTNEEIMADFRCHTKVLESLSVEQRNSVQRAITFNERFSRVITLLPWFNKVPRVFDMSELKLSAKLSPPSDFENAIKHIKPLDLFTTRGHVPFSKLIQCVQDHSRGCDVITHTGLFIDTTVVRFKGMRDGEMYVIESVLGGALLPATDSVCDIAGGSNNGVQIRSLRSIMMCKENEFTAFGWASLRPELRAIVDRNVGFNRINQSEPCAVASNLQKYIGKPYTSSNWNFLYGMTGNDFFTTCCADAMSPVGEDFFCSEVCVRIQVDAGVLPAVYGGATARKFYPVDFLMTNSALPPLYDKFSMIHHPKVSSSFKRKLNNKVV